ncbi:MAG: GNAT family N-acetyltransferase [Proteobacteria bacterium]|nr:GNAT family N-acetyltransferase [Pseudomonadota bacterium]
MAKLELAEGVAGLPRDEWNALVGEDGSPFLEWDWLAALETSGCLGPETGWQPRPLIAREDGRIVAACPLYMKGHSEGEFVFDSGWADAAQRAGIDYYPKLLVGVPFTPVTGARLLVAPGADRGHWQRQLAEALRELCRSNDLSGVHVNFCRENELEPLSDSGYLTRVGIQYHWHNAGYESFDDYLARFRSKRRNQIRRERREMEKQGVTIEALAGDAIPDDLFPPMYRFYLATIRSRYWGRQYLNMDFFDQVRERFRHRLVFVVARQGGEPIAGTFNVAKGDALYGRYWGAGRALRHLHFNVCYYAAIEYCIGAGLARFEPGAGGDYKMMRGFDASPTYSGHFLTDPRLSHAVARFLEAEREEARQTLDWMQEESPLKALPD